MSSAATPGVGAPTPGPVHTTPLHTSDFRSVFDGCPGCGWVVSDVPCPGCGDQPSLPTDPVELHPLLGRVVRGGALPWRQRGVVVDSRPGEVTILRAGGTVARLPERRCRHTQAPPGLARVRSPAGALLTAAAGSGLPPSTSQELHRRAMALAAGVPGGWRMLAADCAALGWVDLLAALPLPDTERTWWSAQAMWVAGHPADAVAALLRLPAGRYPGRIALWWRAAVTGSLPESLRDPVAAAAREFASAPPAVTVAAALLLRKIGEPTGQAGDRELVGAVRALGGDRVAGWLDGRQGGSTAAKLLGALGGAVDVAALEADPALPDAAPREVLDELADRAAIPEAWFAAGEVGRYLRARTAIDTLDDAQLIEIGGHDERARRSVRAGRPLPEDLPAEVAARFSSLPAALAGDEAALLTCVGAAGLDPEQLRAALADPALLPAGALLADRSVAQLLLARSTADPAAWVAVDTDPHQREFAAHLALRRARSQLYAWDWSGALATGRTCLRFAVEETLRDEAHNLIAAAQWQLGNDQAASQALAAALDGEYTAALQVNFAVVASELEPRQAAEHLGRLVREAPDLPLRTSAALQAVRLWRSGEQWQRGDPLPADLAGALRSLVVEPLEYDAFRDLVRLLATHDHEWLAGPGALDRSPHRATVAARIWTANARGPEEFVQELARALGGSPEGWVEELRDQLLQDLVEELRTPGQGGAWRYGLLLLEHRFPLPLSIRVVILALAVPEVCAGIDPREAEPADKFLDWLDEAATEVARLPEEERGSHQSLLRPPLSALAMSYVNSRRHQYGQAEKLYESIRAQIASVPLGMTVDAASVKRAAQPGLDLCRQTITLLQRLTRTMALAGLDRDPGGPAGAIRDLSASCARLQTRLTEVTRSPAGPGPLGHRSGPPSGLFVPPEELVAGVAWRLGMTPAQAVATARQQPDLLASKALLLGLDSPYYDQSGRWVEPGNPDWWRRAALGMTF